MVGGFDRRFPSKSLSISGIATPAPIAGLPAAGLKLKLSRSDSAEIGDAGSWMNIGSCVSQLSPMFKIDGHQSVPDSYPPVPFRTLKKMLWFRLVKPVCGGMLVEFI